MSVDGVGAMDSSSSVKLPYHFFCLRMNVEGLGTSGGGSGGGDGGVLGEF